MGNKAPEGNSREIVFCIINFRGLEDPHYRVATEEQ